MYFIIVNYHNNPRFEDLWVAQQSSGETKENILLPGDLPNSLDIFEPQLSSSTNQDKSICSALF